VKKIWLFVLIVLMFACTNGVTALVTAGLLVRHEKTKYVGCMTGGKVMYLGVTLPAEHLSSEQQENYDAARYLLTHLKESADQTAWENFHSQKIPDGTSEVFVFKVVFPDNE